MCARGDYLQHIDTLFSTKVGDSNDYQQFDK